MSSSLTPRTAPVPRLVPPQEHDIAERVGEEILQKHLNPAAWAKALAAAGASNSDAYGEYARIRIAELSDQSQRKLRKPKPLAFRRLDNSNGAKTVKEMLARRDKVHAQPNSSRPEISLIWLASLMLGTAGSIGCGVRLFGGISAPSWTPALAILCGTMIAVIALLLRSLLPRKWVRTGFQLGMGAATMGICLLSLYLGAKLMVSAPQQWRLVRKGPVSIPVRVETAISTQTAQPLATATAIR